MALVAFTFMFLGWWMGLPDEQRRTVFCPVMTRWLVVGIAWVVALVIYRLFQTKWEHALWDAVVAAIGVQVLLRVRRFQREAQSPP